MTTFILFVVFCFTAAYGNAMRKVTWNRRIKAEKGEPTAGTSKAYDVTGNVLLWGGLIALGAWCVYASVGNPITFVEETFGSAS